MTDEELSEIEERGRRVATAHEMQRSRDIASLVAEVRRLRPIEAAARAMLVQIDEPLDVETGDAIVNHIAEGERLEAILREALGMPKIEEAP